MKKKNETIKLARDLTVGSVALGVGAGVAGKLGAGAPAAIQSNVGSAFGITSMALPIMAAGGVMKSTKYLEEAVRQPPPKRRVPKRRTPKWI